MHDITDVILRVNQELEQFTIHSKESYQEFKVKFIGKKGKIQSLYILIKQVNLTDRPFWGKKINDLRAKAKDKLTAASSFEEQNLYPKENSEDRTLPGYMPSVGNLHPLTQVMQEIQNIFTKLGFQHYPSQEIEDDFHNFSALNFPMDHPARDMQDTFFIKPDKKKHLKEDLLLRTHTSPGQIRLLLKGELPLRAICSGRVYRNEAITHKSYCLFHQVEAIAVDANVSMAELKQVICFFLKSLLGNSVKIRFRASFFPFTEPSAEVDVLWNINGKLTWTEVLGCGMVHPSVLRNCQIDPNKYCGYALGLGIERLTMILHNINDIRLFYQNDIRFLSQFG